MPDAPTPIGESPTHLAEALHAAYRVIMQRAFTHPPRWEADWTMLPKSEQLAWLAVAVTAQRLLCPPAETAEDAQEKGALHG